MSTDEKIKAIKSGKTALGIEFGSTRIKAVLIDESHQPVERAFWAPNPDLRTAAAAWIYAGEAHHTSFSFDLTYRHLEDFAEMAGIEFLLIDEHTRLPEFKKQLRWNDLYYQLIKRC